MRSVLAILFFAASAHAAVRADDAAQFEIRRAPAWIDTIAVDAHAAGSNARSGIQGLLDDHQVRVEGANVDEYFRRVHQVVSSAGVQNASELNIDFDPSYQLLVLHDVVVIRGNKRIDELAQDEVRIIEKESAADESIYDGQLTALLFLKDVRPGDVIDYSWSLEGSNPLLGGRYADEYDFSTRVPTRLMRHRLVWPKGRPLHVNKPAQITGDAWIWERRNVAANDAEDATPDWYEPSEVVQVTEYASWSEVAKWADALFQLDDASRATIAGIADDIRKTNHTRDAQLVAAIRFVQDDIRYLGIEMGRGSHEPRQPAVVMNQRYGDCKDKALFLSALLRALGVEAYPALVNTKLRRHLDDYLPSPFLFDHVIAQVIDGGKTYWIDGTLSDQGGTLATIDTPSDERALIVRPQTNALAPIVVQSHGSIAVEEIISGSRGSGVVETDSDTRHPTPDSHRLTLEVTSTYSGRDADDMRAELSGQSLADVAKTHLNRYAADHPRIEALGAPSIDDDRGRNVIVLRERYAIRDLWTNGSWTYYPRAVEQHLTRPDTLVRSMPLAVDYPRHVTERLIVRGGANAQVEEDDSVVDSPALHYEQHVARGRDLVITTTLRAMKDAVSVAAVPDHLAALNEMHDALAVTLEPAKASMTPHAAELGGGIVIIGIVAALAIRRRSARPTP
jgi:transglutaminase-like putative cysteine protease